MRILFVNNDGARFAEAVFAIPASSFLFRFGRWANVFFIVGIMAEKVQKLKFKIKSCGKKKEERRMFLLDSRPCFRRGDNLSRE